MDQNHLEIIDIKEHFDEYKMLWYSCLDYIQKNCSNDILYKNYLNIDLDKFDCFIVVIDIDEIVSFGGVEHNPEKWGVDVSRVLTKFWIKPTKRTHGLTKWRNNSIKYSPTILTPQIEFLKKQNKIKSAIITREGCYNKSFKEIIRLANTVSCYEFKIMSGRYNVCQPMSTVPESCQQLVSMCSFTNESVDDIFSRVQKLGFFKEIK